MIIGLTSGCFDLLHVGHLHYLERCAARCDKLIVAVDSDAMIKVAKGPARPFIPELERLLLVQGQSCVSLAFLMHALDDLHRVSIQFRVAKVFKHEGYRDMPTHQIVGVHGTGAQLEIVPDEPGFVSTTQIAERIHSRMRLLP